MWKDGLCLFMNKLIAVSLFACVPFSMRPQTPVQSTQAQPPSGAQDATQQPPVIENTGKAITFPYQCTGDDIHYGGLACTEDDPCPIYLELSSAEGAGGRIFAAGNIHSESVTLYSLFLSSEDGGHTWTEPSPRLRGVALDRMQLLEGSGWVSGQVEFPIAQDPFFLVTSDSGATWSQRPIFSEPHFGSIVQFGFDSRTSGTAILDLGPDSEGGRYGRYESSDGGVSWSVKELSAKPLSLKRPPTPSATWRVRVDAALRAYRIEHRQGDRWTSAADFSVNLPACKPQ